MYRLVIDKNIEALKEFQSMGIPLDHALDYAVQKGHMPLIEELLNLGVEPSNATLLRAVRRGVSIRNMFLERVTPTVDHLNSAIFAENFDTANLLLDRGVEPDFQTVVSIKGGGEQTEERKQFIERMVRDLKGEDLNRDGTLKRMVCWTSIAQFERALDRIDPLPVRALNRLLEDCLRAAAFGHARTLLNRGAVFTAEHLLLCKYSTTHPPSQNNPTAEWPAVFTTVLETAIEEGCLFEATDHVYSVVRLLVIDYAFVPESRLVQYCELLARACKPEIRESVGRLAISEAEKKRIRGYGKITMEDLNSLVERIRPMFTEDAPLRPDYTYDSGIAP